MTGIITLPANAPPVRLPTVGSDPVADARELVGQGFPSARWAVLAGSVTTVRRTAGSDLDIVVVLPDDDPRAPHRDSLEFRGWPVELFVHDATTLAHYLAKDLPARRPVMHRMVATGILLTGDDPHAAQVRTHCARVLAEGPTPLSDDELAYARYALTDLLDDLAYAEDSGEGTVIAASAWVKAAQLALAVGRHWSGTGKWLLRELRDMDPELADRWVAAHANPDAVAVFAREVLDRAGGPLFTGYRLPGERPTS